MSARGRTALPYLYLLPAFLFFVPFVLVPFVHTVGLSFYDWDGLTAAAFTGFDNYREAFASALVRSAFGHALGLVFFFGVLPVLLALPLAGQRARIEVTGELISKPYVEITLNMLQRFGIAVAREGWSAFTIAAGSRYVSPKRIYVEGDASSASYFLAAGALGGSAGGDSIRVEGVGRGSIQGDVRFTEVLERMGARVSMGEGWVEASGGQVLKPIDMDLNHIPDAAMTAAVLALFASGPSVIRFNQESAGPRVSIGLDQPESEPPSTASPFAGLPTGLLTQTAEHASLAAGLTWILGLSAAAALLRRA